MKKSSKVSDDPHEMVPTLESAAREAALADGIISSDGSNDKSKKSNLRRGKWTSEEEEYANRLISEFKLGLLPLTDGTTLRTFLSKLLNCDPMRISKKFVGQNCIGKQVFRRRQQDFDKLTNEQIERSRKELAELERKFQERVLQTSRSLKSSTGKDGGSDDEHAPLPWMHDEPAAPTSSDGPKPNGRATSSIPQSKGVISLVGASVTSTMGASSSSSSTSNANLPDQVQFANNLPQFPQTSYSLGEGEYASMPQMNPGGMYVNGFPPYYAVPPPGANYLSGLTMAVPKDSSGGINGSANGFPRTPSFDVFYPNSSLEMNQFRSSFAFLGPDGLPANSSFGFPSQDWPSMSNLLGNESMENIAQLMQSYQVQQNGDIPPSIKGDSDDRNVELIGKDQSKLIEDIGYPLDEPISGSTSGFQYRTKPTEQEIKVPAGSKMVDQLNFNIPSDSINMVVSSGNRQNGIDTNSLPIANSMAIPRNSSVDNFWMLVNLGDLPRPDHGVLSETLWQSKHIQGTAMTTPQVGPLSDVSPETSQLPGSKRNHDKTKVELTGSKKAKPDSLFSK